MYAIRSYYEALVGVSREQAELLRPEMTTQVQIVVDGREDVLLIPNNALKWVEDRHRITSYNVCYTKLLR